MTDERKRIDDLLFERRAKQKQQQREQRSSAPNVAHIDDARERRSRYAQRALEAELASIAQAETGRRNDALNAAAFSLGQLVAAGALDEHETRTALHAAALAAGLTATETPKTIESGLSKGKLEPRDLNSTQLAAARDTTSSEHPFGDIDEQPPVEPPTDDELADFWSARPLLKHVEQYARSRRVAPWAVLGCVLVRIAAVTPPSVALPPIVGGHASLNIFVGLVGPSGSGKGAAERVAAECIRYGEHIVTATTGSGEGIVHAFKRRERNGDETQHTQSVLFSVPEIDTLAALGSRTASTLMPELRRAWSGESLGFQYVDPQKRLRLEEHSYRMTLVAGVQPARAAVLLDDSDGGTPQRFIWCLAIDRDAPDVAPDTPDVYVWRRPAFTSLTTRDAFGAGLNVMHVCRTARDAIEAAWLARTRGQGDALDGHALLAQLKIAAVLSIADSRCDVTDDDWKLAQIVMKQSDATRAAVAQTLASAARRTNAAKADAEAYRAVIVDERTHEAQMKRAARGVLRLLKRHDGEWVARGTARRDGVASRDRLVADAAIEALLSTGQIEEQRIDEKTSRLRVVEQS